MNKYNVGDKVGVKIVHGDNHITKCTVLEVINCRVDGEWGYKYRLNESGGLWVKEQDIIGEIN